MNTNKLTQSIIPVIILLSLIFFILLFVEYKAVEESQKAQYIHITKNSFVEDVQSSEENSIVDVDFSDDARIVEAQKLITLKKYTDAENIYFSILSNEESAQVYNWLGVLYLKEKKYNKASVSFSNALKINENYYKARYNRAMTYTALNDRQKAISDYEDVIASFYAHAKSHFNLALLFYQGKNYEEAIVEFKNTISLSSGDKKVKSFYLLGKSYMKIDKRDKSLAMKAFEEAIRLKPNHIASRLALIELRYENNESAYAHK